MPSNHKVGTLGAHDFPIDLSRVEKGENYKNKKIKNKK